MIFKRMFRQKICKYKSTEGEYDNLKRIKRLILCVTVGRSGSRWLADIFGKHNKVVSSVERLSDMEAFYRYVKWYKLNVDLTGVISALQDSIVQDWKSHDTSVIVSPYLSHDLKYLCDELGPDSIIWCVNDPKFTITSFYNKGWYKEYDRISPEFKIPGLHPGKSINHAIGRVIPNESQYKEWLSMTRVGKISWFYNAVNMEISESLKNIPIESKYTFKLEESDQYYDFYISLAKTFSLTPILSESEFLKIKKTSVRKKDNTIKLFTASELAEIDRVTDTFYTEIYLKLGNMKKVQDVKN